MRFFHISDLHIGLKLMNRDMQEDQAYILKEIVRLAEEKKPDAVVVAGDIYDRAVPSAEAVEIFSGFTADLMRAVPEAAIMMISGNHDSAQRIDCFRSVLSRQNLYMIGTPPQTPEESIQKVTLCDSYGSVCFYLLPYVRPSMVKEITGTDQNGKLLTYQETIKRLLARENLDPSVRNVLVSHQFYLPAGKTADEVERMDSEIRTVGNIDQVSAEVLKPFDYAALGHIHKPMKVGSEYYRYCGTPLACSVSEAGQQKGVIQVDMGEKGRTKTAVLPLVPLHPVRVIRGTLEEVLGQGCTDYVTAILTDRVDLDILDMQDRLRLAFPNLLEIRRERRRSVDYRASVSREAVKNPYELCCSFLKDTDSEERKILRDVIRTVQEVV
ncbi:exonuclease SbcCD subunit D [Bilifractor porci]|uniref:Nuclease SbcCD subunit D n=1 Tax=Bilifractor porci TaxID=2606636 RepID=A0A7X2P8C2_9FIRM|nr:exonuclease SbcCD subunit D [Bilifractor porci]MST82092.1 exonuclease SbcCD subunit D [Bilifractor porci]